MFSTCKFLLWSRSLVGSRTSTFSSRSWLTSLRCAYGSPLYGSVNLSLKRTAYRRRLALRQTSWPPRAAARLVKAEARCIILGTGAP